MSGRYRLIAAAIEFKGKVWPGDRHGNIIAYLVKTGIATEEDRPLTDENSVQGFIDSNGKFWSREHARDIAINTGQIKPDHGTLYSEDLW